MSERPPPTRTPTDPYQAADLWISAYGTHNGDCPVRGCIPRDGVHACVVVPELAGMIRRCIDAAVAAEREACANYVRAQIAKIPNNDRQKLPIMLEDVQELLRITGDAIESDGEARDRARSKP